MKWVGIACLLAASGAVAELKWERLERRLEVHPVQVSASAVFRFTNTGKKPVTITDVRLTCSCLSKTLARRSCAPGETGELTIGFDLRDRAGPQRKAVIVRADDGSETRLYVECDVPAVYVPKQKIIRWSKDDSAQTKTIPLVNAGTLPVRLLSVTSSHKDIPARLNTVRDGFEYEVVIQRRASVSNVRSVIRIATEPRPGQSESKTIRLYVHAP
jgi:hypothetical protein